MDSLTYILEKQLVAIIRGAKKEDVFPIATAIAGGGIKILEITLNSPGALDCIRDLSKKLDNKVLIGAGTVLDESMAVEAIDAGAKFIISPNTDARIIAKTKEKGAVSIPGAYTPTEIVTAFWAGGDLVKVFPVPGPQYIRDLRGPLPHIPLMPTGGINLDSIRQFRDAGAKAYGIGSSLFSAKDKVTKEYLSGLTQKAKKFVEAIAG